MKSSGHLGEEVGSKGVGCGLGCIVVTASTKPAAFREYSSAWGARSGNLSMALSTWF